MTGKDYSSTFYSAYADDSLTSAREVLRLVQQIVDPKSVVDVGCGIGTWLKAWMELGVADVLGMDGSYVRREELLIPPDRFKGVDLSAALAPAGRFDLVQSLEVAEHLPEARAEDFVKFLCSLGDVVLFSAAIPYQGGTHHINEQWPEYWAELFARRGFVTLDVVRDLVWDNRQVSYYYAQNAFLFVRPERMGALRLPDNALPTRPQMPLSRVHPMKWIEKNTKPLGLRQAVAMLPRSGGLFVSRVIQRLRRGLGR